MPDVEWTGVAEFTAGLQRIGERALVETRLAVAEAAAEVERAAKQNASGRPGPNVVTGTLRRGIMTEPLTPWGIAGWQTKVGPTVIYSRRIELGFQGADSLGRVYSQPPYPYFGPAWAQVYPRINEIYRRHMAVALSAR